MKKGEKVERWELKKYVKEHYYDKGLMLDLKDKNCVEYVDSLAD